MHTVCADVVVARARMKAGRRGRLVPASRQLTRQQPYRQCWCACLANNRLAAARVLLAEASQADLNQRLRLNVGEDDVAFALRNDELMRRLLGPR